jgi:glyoxylase-like metal-dependent hydrolase (beta-lactamase superfamily II)
MTAAIGDPTLRLLRVRISGFELGELLQGEERIVNAAERQPVVARAATLQPSRLRLRPRWAVRKPDIEVRASTLRTGPLRRPSSAAFGGRPRAVASGRTNPSRGPDTPMQTRTDEIAPGIFRLSTLVPEAGPGGFTFNQFLIRADEPLLFHTGPRAMFPLVSAAVARLVPLEQLRWLTFGHVEADECGSMNRWLAAAPRAEIAHGGIGVMVSLNDLADRPPRALADGEILELGGMRVRHIDTPHVPHAWEARVLFEETTRTLLCGDLFTQLGDGPALTSDDIVGSAQRAEELFHSSCLTPTTGAVIRNLAELAPTTLAVMHGSSFAGDAPRALRELAGLYEGWHAAAQGGPDR